MTAVRTKDDTTPTAPVWSSVGGLTVSLAVVANKVRKARGSTDLLVHADVIIGFAGLLVIVAKVRRDLRKPAA